MKHVRQLRYADAELNITRVGALLLHARKKHNISNPQMALILGYKNMYNGRIKQLLTGEKELPFNRIHVVSSTLNIPIDELLVAISEDFQMRLVLSVGNTWPHLREKLFLE